jgi:hypothetical protein
MENENRRPWTGYIISGLPVLFLLLDSIGKFFMPVQVVEGTVALGYSTSVIIPLGIILLVCTILYTIPKTSVLGAILLTGYLGGAVATHVRVGNSFFGHILFPVYLGIMLWLGLYSRESRLKDLLPLRG